MFTWLAIFDIAGIIASAAAFFMMLKLLDVYEGRFRQAIIGFLLGSLSMLFAFTSFLVFSRLRLLPAMALDTHHLFMTTGMLLFLFSALKFSRLGESYFQMLQTSVTNGKSLEQRLHEAALRHELSTSNARLAVYDWDLHADSVGWNKYARTLIGPNVGSGTKPIAWTTDGLYEEDKKRVRESLDEAIRSKKTCWDGEYQRRRPDGQDVSIVDRACIFYGRDSKPIRIIGSLADVSDLTELKSAVQRVSADWEKAMKMIAEREIKMIELKKTMTEMEKSRNKRNPNGGKGGEKA